MKTCLIFGNGYICKSFIKQYEKNINFIIVSHELYDINNPNYEYLESYISIYNIDKMKQRVLNLNSEKILNKIKSFLKEDYKE